MDTVAGSSSSEPEYKYTVNFLKESFGRLSLEEKIVQTIAYNSHYGITYQYLRFGMMDILRHTEANHRYIMLYMYTMIPITLESALKQVQVYEDWPHHLLLKTCYRTSTISVMDPFVPNLPTDSCLSMDVSTQIPH
ncbi:hypothetical protein NQ317_018960 [Molorchus minor]|uniref:Uncharacterized protein n=1 Tax=Molorchus minor TaxID=1323400 RepID=A0ABQ9JIT4_9CUCU|nr:hypothetical protein NQ317_018960 [Molorchus minor]